MNNKGFTMIELLAVIVVLSVIMGIATLGVTNTIKNSKLKSEEIFVEKINSLIDDYIDYVNLNEGGFHKNGEPMAFEKCNVYTDTNKSTDDDGGTCQKNPITVNAYLMKKKDGNDITLYDLVDTKLISEDDFKNPNTKKKCENLEDTNIYIFKDDDAVYYYFVDLESSCGIKIRINEEDNTYNYVNIINTLPDDLISGHGSELVSILGDKYEEILNDGDDIVEEREDTEDEEKDSKS